MTSLFPWSPPELEELQVLFLAYSNNSYDNCTCGCRGFPLSILTIEFQEQEIDRENYLKCPARIERKSSKAWEDFQGDETYLKFLRDVYPIRYPPSQKKIRKLERQKKEQQFQLARRKAQNAGMKTYKGSPCVNGHSGERGVKHNECIHCRSAFRSLRDAIKRGAFKESLTKQEKNRIATIYAKSRKLTKETGIQHHVDHIKPLAAGGRHHPDNLQILTADQNLKKGSKYEGKVHTYKKTASQNESRKKVSQPNLKKEPQKKQPKVQKENKKGFWQSIFG